jgi:hypothetical protein
VGPPPLARLTKQFFEMSAPDIAVRRRDEGRPALAPLVHPHEIKTARPGHEGRPGDRHLRRPSRIRWSRSPSRTASTAPIGRS